MRAFFASYDRTKLRHDLLASLVVFLVALPLCMGIAIASGVPPAAGILTGIIGGLVVGFLAGSPLQVSGPAAGLTVLVYEIVQHHGIGMLGAIVLLAGLIQLAAGFIRLGAWFRAVSPAVVHGMLAGIGLLIIASQLHVMVDDKPRGGGLANLLAIPEAIWKGVMPIDGSTHHLAAAIGLLTIATIIAWSFAPKQLKAIPAPLVGVVVATVATALLQVPIQTIALPENLWQAVQWPTLANLSGLFEQSVLISAVALAVVASAETMLTATAVDSMHNGERTNYDRELMAQGAGNMLCGVVGALPMTGVIVRSSANVQAGAATRMSAVFHGAWILLFVAALPWLLSKVPTTALAALLVFTGFKLLSPAAVRKLRAHGWGEVAIYVVTIGAIVATNLLEGILIGLGLALMKQLWTLSHLASTLKVSPDGKTAELTLHGAATFIGLPRLAAKLEQVPAGAELHLNVSRLSHIDHACLDMLAVWEKQHAAAGGRLVVDWDSLTSRPQGPRTESGQLASIG